MKVSFKKRYFIPFLLVLVCEIAIAIFHFHRFVRGFLGDVLVIPLLYFFLRTFSNLRRNKTLVLVLIFGCIVEILQLIDLAVLFNIQSNVLTIILGNTFDWTDLIAYVLGGIIILLLEKLKLL
ncbi:MAG: DUF2809 domain-containing protein [Bacteroidia bacterium]|nr:DUF2809 domain-containing protein [Bacteroidia bacterium]NNF32298.1 DUF2809 domain-containing protein [Flavobacteriaceae bacterium]MBT8276940.1 DUF2809 domain-containing protein [Bacteroidia bacterium]NNJ83279.1 DUF2809 domain-containing protein [Flavobacteriaceae bacterium]NNK53743.1 DUF2809 domain-containing protein [Flavobacteriaceae bacterium]